MKKGFLRYTAAFIIGMIIVNAISVTAFASQPEYIDYQRKNSDIKKSTSSVEVALDSFSTDSASAEFKLNSRYKYELPIIIRQHTVTIPTSIKIALICFFIISLISMTYYWKNTV